MHRLKWSPQKPETRAVERDEEAVGALETKRLAAGKKNAARLGAHLVFADESGFLLAPLVLRTWAPQGATPLLSPSPRTPGQNLRHLGNLG